MPSKNGKEDISEEEDEYVPSSEQESCDEEISSSAETSEDEEEEEVSPKKKLKQPITKHKLNKKLPAARSGSTENEEEHPSTSDVKKSPSSASKKRGRDEETDKSKASKKRKTDEDEMEMNNEEESGEKNMSKVGKNNKKAPQKKEPNVFDDRNVDKNFNAGNPNAVAHRKVKLNQNYMVSCKMIEANESKGKLAYDYAGLIFQRRTKDNKAYEFNCPLSLCPFIVNALQYLMSENRAFFNLPVQSNDKTEN